MKGLQHITSCGGYPVQLCSITPIDGGYRICAYHSAGPAHSKSSAVTRPFVTSLILRTRIDEGARSPVMYLDTEAGETPIASANSAWESPCSDRKSMSFMTSHYHDGNRNQAPVVHLVTDNVGSLPYHKGMSEGLAKLIRESGKTVGEIGREAFSPALSGAQVSRFQTGERNMPDYRVAQAAAYFKVSPFVIKPDYGEQFLAGLSPERRGPYLEGLKTLYQLEGLERTLREDDEGTPRAQEGRRKSRKEREIKK